MLHLRIFYHLHSNTVKLGFSSPELNSHEIKIQSACQLTMTTHSWKREKKKRKEKQVFPYDLCNATFTTVLQKYINKLKVELNTYRVAASLLYILH